MTSTDFFAGFVHATIDELGKQKCSTAAICRLATANGESTLRKIIRLANAEWRAEGSQPYQSGLLKESKTLTAPVVYTQPNFDELERFFQGYLDPNYKDQTLSPIECCKAVTKEARRVPFEYVELDHDGLTDEVLAKMEDRRLRPGLYEELIGFAKEYPSEQKKHPIAALGSTAEVGGRLYSACLYHDANLEPTLNLLPNDRVWRAICLFLAVPL